VTALVSEQTGLTTPPSTMTKIIIRSAETRNRLAQLARHFRPHLTLKLTGSGQMPSPGSRAFGSGYRRGRASDRSFRERKQ
jgi:hypothetical protein